MLGMCVLLLIFPMTKASAETLKMFFAYVVAIFISAYTLYRQEYDFLLVVLSSKKGLGSYYYIVRGLWFALKMHFFIILFFGVILVTLLKPPAGIAEIFVLLTVVIFFVAGFFIKLFLPSYVSSIAYLLFLSVIAKYNLKKGYHENLLLSPDGKNFNL